MIKMAHRNAESKPKQWEWDNQRAIHIRMRHKNVKKMYYRICEISKSSSSSLFLLMPLRKALMALRFCSLSGCT